MPPPWLLAARPKTLAAAVVPVLIGTALAAKGPLPLDWRLFACTLLGAGFIQIGTNFVNDALDFKKGTDTHERLGPLRVTQAAALSAGAPMPGRHGLFFLPAPCLLAPLCAVGGLLLWRGSRAWLLRAWLALPLGLALLVRVYRSEGAAPNQCLAICGALQWAFGILFVVGATVG